MDDGTIDTVVKKGLCTGCGTCIALCPNDAIELRIRKEKGIYVPEMDNRKCNNCGICLKVCPGHEVDFTKLGPKIIENTKCNKLIGNYLNCFIGYSKNQSLRYYSTSGGLITQILIYLLEKKIIDGALVTRMKKGAPFEPEPFIARTKEEIIEASGSKYCPVPANIALREIINSKEGERFAIVGLSCHIHGIRKAEKINRILRDRIRFHLGIVCNHTPSFQATRFLLNNLKIREDYVTKIDYRGNGWPGAMKIQFNDDSSQLISLGEYWGNGFGQRFLPIRCTLCCDHTAELSDISFADAWIPEIQKYDDIGTSAIIIRNQGLDTIIDRMITEEVIELKGISNEKIIQSQTISLNFKKKGLKARMAIVNLFGKGKPDYKSLDLTNPTLRHYISGVMLYIRLYVSSREYLWASIHIYQAAIRKILNFVRRRGTH